MARETYSQVELNRCAFLHDGAIESQCKAVEALENGQIVAVDKAKGEVKVATGTSAEEGMVYGINYTAERIYDQFTPGRKYFRVEKDEYPRVGILKAGDIFTTDANIEGNCGPLKLVVVDANADCADGTKAKKYMVL
jgi:hypothetical protein